MPTPRFAIGELIHHRKYNYRGVIIDVDATYRGSEEWYEHMARSRPPRDQPWYSVLVDGAEHGTYVAERHLEPDGSDTQVEHPALGAYFRAFTNGRYIPRQRRH